MSVWRCSCGSIHTEIIGHYSILIALDDQVDVLQSLCKSCGREWEE